jgi:hypothetical protein
MVISYKLDEVEKRFCKNMTDMSCLWILYEHFPVMLEVPNKVMVSGFEIMFEELHGN